MLIGLFGLTGAAIASAVTLVISWFPRPVCPHDINHFTQRSTGSLLRKAITSGSIVS